MEKSGNLMSAVLQSHSKAGSEWEWERERVHESAPCVLQLFFSQLLSTSCLQNLQWDIALCDWTRPPGYKKTYTVAELRKGKKGSFLIILWSLNLSARCVFGVFFLYCQTLSAVSATKFAFVSLSLDLWCLWAYPFCPAVPLFVSGVALDISV